MSPNDLDLPLLNIQLEARFDRRLQASIHAPGAVEADTRPPVESPPPDSPTPSVPSTPLVHNGNAISPNKISPPTDPDPPDPKESQPPTRRSARTKRQPDRLGN
ncbi:hypothetical protein PCASD_17312 [Puccinia coronata f. sp. avenae]|uniref:Uncharacterized protein n=1 Tax=Puccinia coronata f. sp. avenae TaxID=200324 RepID=A0A2N5U2J1_9BASI|nr:hypothetical protein PCASD_17312 [Puccinia coronata f. sp. avenae]